MKNFFELSGLPVNASPEEIKAEFRRLAKIHHPDKGGDPETFTEIQAAYAVLEDNDFALPIDGPGISSGKVPVNPDLPYDGLLNINETLTSYIKVIFASLDKKIINPAEILRILLNEYIGSSQSIFTLWGRSLSNLNLAKELLSLLEKDKTLFALQKALTTLDETKEIFTEARFTELFNAFFSFYPIYFEQLKNARAKIKFRIIEVDDICMRNILVRQAENIFNRTNYIILRDEEEELLQVIGQMSNTIDYIAKKFQVNRKDPLVLGVLSQISRHASREQMENDILPVIIEELNKEGHETNILIVSDGYAIVTQAIKIVDPATIENKILPLLEMNAGKCYDAQHICALLAEIAIIFPNKLENKILPIIIKLIQTEGRSRDYDALNKILYLIPDTILQRQISPLLLAEIRKNESLTLASVLKIYMKLSELAAKENSEIKLMLVCELKHLIHAKLTEAVKILGPDSESLLKDKIAAACILQHSPEALDGGQLYAEILAVIRQNIQNEDPAIRGHIFNAISLLAGLEKDKLANINMKELFQLLLTACESLDYFESVAIDKNNIDAYCAYQNCYQAFISCIKFADASEVEKLFFSLLVKVRFEDGSFRNHMNLHRLKALAEVCKKVNPEFVQGLLRTLINKIDFSILGSSAETFKIFNVALELTDKNTLTQKIFPVLLDKCGSLSDGNLIKCLGRIIRDLSYPERVYYLRVIMKSYEYDSLSKSTKSKVLKDFYLQNKTELKKVKEHPESRLWPQQQVSERQLHICA